jgi:hypothetical protein
MRRKILCIGIIGAFLLSSLSFTAIGMNTRDVNEYSISTLDEKADVVIKVIDKDGRIIVGQQVNYKFKTEILGLVVAGDARTKLNGKAYIHLTQLGQPRKVGDLVRVWSTFKGETKYWPGWPTDESFHQITNYDVENGIYEVLQFNAEKSNSKSITHSLFFTQILKLFPFLYRIINW